jgi:outer membrane protein TolC
MNKFFVFIATLGIILPTGSNAQDKFSMEDVVSRALIQSPAFKQAETRKENRFWRYRYFKTNYNPQLRMSSNNAGSLYNNSFTPVRQPDGTIRYLPLNQLNPGVNFGLQQPIQWTGGMIYVNSSYNYFNNITDDSREWNGAPFNIFVNQPLFAFNQYKWDRKIEPIRFEESKREYAESMEQISSDAVAAFFNVLQAQVDAQIAKFNLANNDTIYKIEQGRYNIGTTSQDKLLQVELQLLRSKQDVAKADLDLQTASLKLRTFIGLRNNDRFDLSLPDAIPQFEVTEEEALQFARQNRAAFIAFERRKLEAEQAVAQARGERYEVGLTASYGTNNVGSSVGDLYQNPTRQQMANVTFNVPLVDWGRRKALMRTALADKRLNDYVIAQEEVTFEQEILTQVRQFEMLRLQIEITKKADEVAQERYMVAQNRYLIGKIDITNLNIALNEKDTAKRSYIEALKSFWTAYYDLRRLTLYDFYGKRLLYLADTN